jgi:small-conductance mechanosensitive channel
MKLYEIQIIETVIVLVLLGGVRFFTKRAIKKLAIHLHVTIERRRVIVRVINFIVLLLVFLLLTMIWGVDRKEMLLFITSTITVLGIAFFAQWSILSNITAGLVMFFTHPAKLGDVIQISEKDYFLQGRLTSISFFFMHLESDDGQHITIPNNITLQKIITIVENEEMRNMKIASKDASKPYQFPKL